MNEMQLVKTLGKLAHYMVRNQIVCEHFLMQELPVSRDEIGAKVREVDDYLKKNIGWQNRFPGVFS